MSRRRSSAGPTSVSASGAEAVKMAKPRLKIDVVDQSHASGRQRAPYSTEFEQDVSGCMHAVVQEKPDRSKLGQNAGQVASARTANVGPAVAELCGHGCASRSARWGSISGGRSMLQRRPRPDRFIASSTKRVVSPRATPVSTACAG